jgi:amidohydrolase
MDPLDNAVVSVCTINAGEAHNVIPDQASLTGTIRSFTPRTRAQLLKRFTDIVESIAVVHRCQTEITIDDISPPVVNDPAVASIIRQIAREIFPDMEIDQTYRTMAGEDMAIIMEQIKGCYFFIGSANPEKGLIAKHHQPDFNFDEDALVTGTALMVGAVKTILR